ncbi:ATP-grasp domain-containing protein [Streptomyces fuscigenes]|uniref:ATP-grasp domain-containing protein n=1 Tax=Streptomyces fuscigenes TaxID=1528880 RepID=UPI001F3306DA|nr:alpha-L-glutamate ligase [Streptomyces fuscigenes]MCF3963547.1 alpha-L-glutamate ligase [Streptomyces fuscigenes]
MRIGLVTSRPDHPLLAGATALLAPRHDVRWLDPERGGAPDAQGPPADVYLLKAHTPAALALARSLEERGAPVLNTAAATELCQDRVAMADLATGAGLPFAATRPVASLAGLLDEGAPGYPLVVKSRHSRRGDLVARADGPADLRGLLPAWRDEPVVVQPFTENSGWDQKIWVIGGRVFAALRRSELAGDPEPVTQDAEGGEAPGRGAAGDGGGPAVLPPGWAALALRAGGIFGLDVYGVDLIDAGGGTPRIVDVNAFPGARGQDGAPRALAALALRAAEEGAAGARAWRRSSVPEPGDRPAGG